MGNLINRMLGHVLIHIFYIVLGGLHFCYCTTLKLHSIHVQGRSYQTKQPQGNRGTTDKHWYSRLCYHTNVSVKWSMCFRKRLPLESILYFYQGNQPKHYDHTAPYAKKTDALCILTSFYLFWCNFAQMLESEYKKTD